MIFGLPIGIFVESAVAILLALTIAYCVVLNGRLKRLHADRDALRQMVNDLVTATNLANQAIKELKAGALEADLALKARLEEAERFGIELANHVIAGTTLIERITKIASAVRQHQAQTQQTAARVIEDEEEVAEASDEPTKIQSALAQLSTRVRSRRSAA